MGRLDAYLEQFDHAWSHAFESIAYALNGVTEEEAAWQPPQYHDEEQEEGWPPPGSIRWQVCHLAHCKRYYTQLLLRAGESESPEFQPWIPLESLEAERRALAAAHDGQRKALVELGESALDAVAGNDMPFHEFIAMFTRHDTWHASQVAIARRLWRAATAD